MKEWHRIQNLLPVIQTASLVGWLNVFVCVFLMFIQIPSICIGRESLFVNTTKRCLLHIFLQHYYLLMRSRFMKDIIRGECIFQWMHACNLQWIKCHITTLVKVWKRDVWYVMRMCVCVLFFTIILFLVDDYLNLKTF